MKQSRKVNGLLQTLLIIGLILIIPLFFAIKSVANAPMAQGTGTPYARATATSVPQSNPSLSSSSSPIQTNAKEPPACAFPLAPITTAESAPENYTFSEPKVVYTPAANDGSVQIVDWLPDNQRVLVVQDTQDSNQQIIELLNSATGEIQVYATREQTEHLPSWDEELKAVVYPVRHVLNTSVLVNGLPVPQFTRQVWISYGSPQSVQLLADNLSQSYVAIKPGGKEIVYLKDKQINKRNSSLQDISSKPLDLDQWNYRKLTNGILPLMYEMAWRPGASQAFLYSFADGKPGYTFLLDVDSGQICELNLGGWAVTARWSPNGRYLAVERSQASGTPVGPTTLTVFDTTTGNLYTSSVVLEKLVGIHAVRGIAWAPDNRRLLVLGSALSFPQCSPNCHDDTRI